HLPLERPRRPGRDRRRRPRGAGDPGSRRRSRARHAAALRRDGGAARERARGGAAEPPERARPGRRARRGGAAPRPARVGSRPMDPANRNTALASALVEERARSGVRQAVICPGSRSTPVALALLREPAIATRSIVDERSAGFFALGAANASGRPVAIACTSGTAAANLHPAVAEAAEADVPLLVLTSDRPPELREIGAGQTIDQL